MVRAEKIGRRPRPREAGGRGVEVEGEGKEKSDTAQLANQGTAPTRRREAKRRREVKDQPAKESERFSGGQESAHRKAWYAIGRRSRCRSTGAYERTAHEGSPRCLVMRLMEA